MIYFILIALFLVAIKWMERNFFQWEVVIRFLWKGLYAKTGEMISHMRQFHITNTDELSLKGFVSQIELRGKLINSILDYINTLRMEENVHAEEETFGYGRYDLGTIMLLAKTKPETFKKFNGKSIL